MKFIKIVFIFEFLKKGYFLDFTNTRIFDYSFPSTNQDSTKKMRQFFMCKLEKRGAKDSYNFRLEGSLQDGNLHKLSLPNDWIENLLSHTINTRNRTEACEDIFKNALLNVVHQTKLYLCTKILWRTCCMKEKGKPWLPSWKSRRGRRYVLFFLGVEDHS